MTTPLPHGPYIDAVMAALDTEGLIDHEESWSEYSSDNSVVMLMDTVIKIDGALARASGWKHGITLLWDQIHGWCWGPGGADGRLQFANSLISHTVTPQPADVLRAAHALLAGEALPIAGRPPEEAAVVPSVLLPLLDEAIEAKGAADVPAEATIRHLATYWGG